MLEFVTSRTFYGNTMLNWILFLTLVVASILIGKLIYIVGSRFFRKLVAKTETQLDDILLDMLEEPIVLMGVITSIWFSFKILTLTEFAEQWVGRAFYCAVIFNIAWLVSRTVDALIEHYIVPMTEASETDLDDILLPLFRRAFGFIVWTVAIIVALDNAGYNVGTIVAGLGLGGLAVAMAAKDTLSNILGGITIFTSKPFKLGDIVRFNGYEMKVKEIGLRSTQMLDRWTSTVYTVPNAIFTDTIVENISLQDGFQVIQRIRLTLNTPAAKQKQCLEAIQNVFDTYPGIDGGGLVFESFEDHGLGIQFWYHIREETMDRRYETQSEVNLAILETLQTHGIEFAFPWDVAGDEPPQTKSPLESIPGVKVSTP